MLDQVVGDKGGYGGVEVEMELNVHIRGEEEEVLSLTSNGISLSSVREVVEGTEK